MEEKIKKLKEILKSYESVIVGFSGGVDSTILCYFAHLVLQDKFLAVTANSETITTAELEEAKKIAETFKWPHLIVESDELKYVEFTNNPKDKCKWCKDIRFKQIIKIAEQKGYRYVASGDNIDDLQDYRPGLKHAHSLGIKSPLLESGITKNEIYSLARELDLPNCNKPANPCLASRIPYGIKITPENLKMISDAEKFLKELGYSPVRIRHHNNLARIEVDKSKIINFVSFHADLVTEKLKEIGYTYVVLDLQGYRTGSLNEVILEDNEH